jgi:hypothetical protein
MNIKDLKPAGTLANSSGVKAIVFGPPGSGKTPIFNTAPRPLLLACEPGLLSMRGSQVPTYQAHSGKTIDDFFQWFFKSNEPKNFDTIGVDSVSQMCDIYLQDALKTNKHGLAAYGEMARNVMDQLRPLFFMEQKHCYLICKQTYYKENGIDKKTPYFPGQQLPTEVPHLYDLILHLGIHNVPNRGQIKSFQCWESIDTLARDRSGKLDEFEPPDFSWIVRKAMG